jgi:hypothetical protein
MADASALKGLKKKRLGLPPPVTEASRNLDEPETGPPAAPPPRLDARSLRRTHRTVQFATRVSPDFDRRIREIAAQERLLLVEIMERALDAYERERDRTS